MNADFEACGVPAIGDPRRKCAGHDLMITYDYF